MIHNVEELEELINKIGFLPLFTCQIPGFSVEDYTDPDVWWTGDEVTDPWRWRVSASRRGNIAYGKFFDNKAGFISKEWIPVFANYRRDGYDFDARWDDELASHRQKKVMDLFLNEAEGEDSGQTSDRELFSFEIKQQAGFGKDGGKNFEGTLTSLEMEFYLICRDFRKRRSKKGQLYGWDIAVLSTPEHVFGAELVRADYDKDPKESLDQIVKRVRECCPEAGERDILKLVAYSEDRPAGKKQALPYPQNLLKAIDKEKDPWSWTKDQVSGLYVALGQLRPKQQRVLWEKYHDGMKNEEIGEGMNRAAGTISSYHGKAMKRLRSPLIAAWYRDGYADNLRACALGQHWKINIRTPEEGISATDLCLRIGLKVDIFERLMGKGIVTILDLVLAIGKNENWYKDIYGVGVKTAEDIEKKLEYFGY